MDLQWWCAQVSSPWSWEWRAYPGVWLSALAMAVPYLVAVRRHSGQVSSRQIALFLGGVIAYWLATDWPLGLLGASYLATAHMLQFMIYTLVAAPLLLKGTPEWMARRLLSRLRLYRLTLWFSRPLRAGIAYNIVLVATHAPWVTDNLRGTQLGSFAMDALWLVSGLILWLPLSSPLPEHTRSGYGAKMVYIFLAGSVVPVLPASFLTFSDFPLYSTFELAPRVFSWLEATGDQQAAGGLMKVGSIPFIWGSMLVMMTRWASTERADDARPDWSEPAPTS